MERRAQRAIKKKNCERSERLKVLGKGFYGVRLGCGVRAAPWANTYGVLAVGGGNPFFKRVSPFGTQIEGTAQMPSGGRPKALQGRSANRANAQKHQREQVAHRIRAHSSFWENLPEGVGGFKIAVLRSKMNSLKGNSSNFESSLLANCVGLHTCAGSRCTKGREGATFLPIAQGVLSRLWEISALCNK